MGMTFLWTSLAFCERLFPLRRQQPEKDKQNVNSAPLKNLTPMYKLN